tara:strand:- start:690 stop:842 length:153 start_codon:yes stop_codon:yes gene_type:complete
MLVEMEKVIKFREMVETLSVDQFKGDQKQYREAIKEIFYVCFLMEYFPND